MGCSNDKVLETRESKGNTNVIQSKIQEENNDNKKVFNNEISFRCTYDIKNINDKILIINDRLKYDDEEFEIINEEIKGKIKLLNGNKKEEITFKRKFDNIGYNTIDFVIETNLQNMSYMFSMCDSLKKIEFFY